MKKIHFFLFALLLVSCSTKNEGFIEENQNDAEMIQRDSIETLENQADDLSLVIVPTADSIHKIIQEEKASCNSCDCVNDPMGGSMAEIAICSTLESLAIKLKMYEVYEQIQKKYADSPVFLKALEKSQKRWIQLREADMEMLFAQEENTESGSGWSESLCWTEHLKELREARIKRLRIWLDKLPKGEICYPSVKR
ncbi:MAG: DUF1311 domain-containing protein [Crocinitomicaceae bacterium]|nr:DUF1311 domain-containing protein [Crocinitomicaceae bacterium]